MFDKWQWYTYAGLRWFHLATNSVAASTSSTTQCQSRDRWLSARRNEYSVAGSGWSDFSGWWERSHGDTIFWLESLKLTRVPRKPCVRGCGRVLEPWIQGPQSSVLVLHHCSVYERYQTLHCCSSERGEQRLTRRQRWREWSKKGRKRSITWQKAPYRKKRLMTWHRPLDLEEEATYRVL